MTTRPLKGVCRTCDHPACAAARLRYQKRWKLDRARGITRTIDPRPVALHVATLQGAGWTARAIAGAAGVAPQTVTRLIRGDAKTVGRDVAAKILAVAPAQVPAMPSHQTTEPFVSRVGTTRRIQALMTMGWSLTYLRDHYDINICTLYQQGQWVTRTTHDKVAKAYTDLAHKPGPSNVTRTRARAKGYADPLAWDDIDHDLAPDYDEAPSANVIDEAAVVRFVRGERLDLTGPERVEAIRRLIAAGVMQAEIARRCGVTDEYVWQIRTGRRGARKEAS